MRCSQEKCENIATHRMFWPGREPMYICYTCLSKAQMIATTMGFYLHTEKLVGESQNGRDGN